MGQRCCADDSARDHFPIANRKQKEESLTVEVPQLNAAILATLEKIPAYLPRVSPSQRGAPAGPRLINSLGSVYIGEWKNSQPNGIGQMYFDDCFMHGTFKDGIPSGHCRMIYSSGVVYEGAVFESKANGYGKLINFNKKYSQEGQWVDDLPHGRGLERWQPDAYYEGEFDKGKKQGEGTYEKANVFKYQGAFISNQFQGEGRLYLLNVGDSYFGSFRDNQFNGQGIYRWKDGSEYEGTYLNGVKHGQGIYRSSNNQSITGIWQHGRRVQQRPSYPLR